MEYQQDGASVAEESPRAGLLTSAHALIIPQHVASRAHALVGAEGVHASEGAQQRILGALVDV